MTTQFIKWYNYNGDNMIKRVINKVKNKKYIKMVEKSPYFDKNFYIQKNPDVVASGMKPAVHYYYNGWKEGRNPSLSFDNNRYFKINKIPPNINPIIHYTVYGKKNNYIVPSSETPFTVDELLHTHFLESTPLKVKYINELKTHRLNIVFNGFDGSCFFGGKATALMLAINFVTKYKYDLRIIAQNPDASVFYDFIKLFKIDFNQKIEFFSTDSNQYIAIGDKDDFLCTMWSNADAILNTKYIKGKIFYIMQEVETFFYDHGDYHLRCFNSLSSNRIIPIVNSKLLYDYLKEHNYDNVKNNGIFFEPVFSKDLLNPSSKSFSTKDKYKLFFYARPGHQRNLFYFCLDVLNEAFNLGILKEDEWEIYTAGDKSVPNFRLDTDVTIKKLGVMSWEEYCSFMSTIDLCFSVIYTPHPSYPPLDAVTAGAVAVTNKFMNKKDLSNYSKNIIMGELNKESMLKALEQGSELSKNSKERKSNYKSTKTIGTWENAFKDVVKFMKNKIGD